MKRLLILLIIIISFFILIYFNDRRFWEIQSIDTTKYSRDLAREKLNDDSFNEIIEFQVKQIALARASHIAISTPYDAEFAPYLVRWVGVARKNNLNVWFRGNLSGWEGWFEYPEITKSEHAEAIAKFLVENQLLFMDGDIFDPCPECENGALGDPRHTGKLNEYREFLKDEHQKISETFTSLGKDVLIAHSMNADVAKLVMNQDTTKKLGGMVTIDHYVADSGKFLSDIREIERIIGGDILIGEFGVPIPDIHGELDESGQSAFIKQTLDILSAQSYVKGVNYWTGFGGSSSLWRDDFSEKSAVDVVEKYYKPDIILLIFSTPAGHFFKSVV